MVKVVGARTVHRYKSAEYLFMENRKVKDLLVMNFVLWVVSKV